MSTFRPVTLIFLIFFLAIQISSAKVDQNKLTIDRVLVDFNNNELIIEGKNFTNGAAPYVNLGDVYDLDVTAFDDNTINILLPANFVPADYRLTVTTGGKDNQSDSYDLTLNKGDISGGLVVKANGVMIGEHIGEDNIYSIVMSNKGYAFEVSPEGKIFDGRIYFTGNVCDGDAYAEYKFGRTGKGSVFANNNELYYTNLAATHENVIINSSFYVYCEPNNNPTQRYSNYIWPIEINNPDITGVYPSYQMPIIVEPK